jgi:Icc-related predicted phosphoesterase
VPTRRIVLVAVNHDRVFQETQHRVPRDLPAVYLQDSGLEWEGLKIWGTPWQPRFFDRAFNLDEPDLATKWALIPDDTDILVAHGPPHGYGDGVPDRGGVRHEGSPSLLRRIEQVWPRLAVFGHIHEGRGQWALGYTVLANVTLLDGSYRPFLSRGNTASSCRAARKLSTG